MTCSITVISMGYKHDLQLKEVHRPET